MRLRLRSGIAGIRSVRLFLKYPDFFTDIEADDVLEKRFISSVVAFPIIRMSEYDDVSKFAISFRRCSRIFERSGFQILVHVDFATAYERLVFR